jgi:hypothetical protein
VRSVAFACAVVLPVVLGLGLLVFYIDGQIGIATTLAAGFSIAAISFTAVIFREPPESDVDLGAPASLVDGHGGGQDGTAPPVESPAHRLGEVLSQALRASR